MAELTETFDGTIATLKRDLPERFVLRVDDREFRDVGSMARAHAIQAAMEGMKDKARAAGYEVTVGRQITAGGLDWLYTFTRSAGRIEGPKPAEPKGEVIDV